eukprot:6196911-Pleurochrysis_carterae.AAC.1
MYTGIEAKIQQHAQIYEQNRGTEASDSWRCSKRRVQAGVQAGGVQTLRAARTLTHCARSDGSAAPADAAPQCSNIKSCRNWISYGMIVPEDPKIGFGQR